MFKSEQRTQLPELGTLLDGGGPIDIRSEYPGVGVAGGVLGPVQ